VQQLDQVADRRQGHHELTVEACLPGSGDRDVLFAAAVATVEL
jgi:hypothetical protein